MAGPTRFLVVAIGLLAATAGPRLLMAQSAGWVSYTAQYQEVVANPGQPQKALHITESRSSDGSVLMIEQDGTRQSGRLWDASGKLYLLDFDNKRANYQQTSPRLHPPVQKAPPLRSEWIAGVQCSVYTVHVSNGTGSLCIDTRRDILMREEIHMNQGQGKMDMVKELTAIDFSRPSDNEKVRLPADFAVMEPTGKRP